MKKQKKLLWGGGIAAILLLAVTLMFPARVITESLYEQNIAVKSGDTLSSILLPYSLSGTDILEIASLLKKSAGVKKLKADGDVVKITRPNETGPVSKIVLQSGPWRHIEFAKTAEGWSCNPIDIEKDIQIVLKSGEIRDGDSFYAAGIRAGIPEPVLADAYDLLAFEMDFERDMRAGQQFMIMYEENYAEGQFVNTGNVIALRFDAGGYRGTIKMYRFGRGYYDERGGGAIKSLKRTPINNARVTSSFGRNRKHPVLGFTRAHRGVDFRAAHGTPIPSAGSGRVVARGANSGYGNYIRIRHNATYETLYAHLSRFQAGVGVGSQVRQGQIVGYVGSTGLSSGPHLHYEIIKNGTRVNPMTVKLPAISNLGGADKTEFLELRAEMDKSIDLMEQFPTLVMYE
ncbi:MAG: peptidoglycan DD-metalloendopeptidase family protein [Rickettsiales bacterium]|nr:peptidoglycan DD-metalloendopeptidase family protein [Rickettsiales bacterium]